MAAAPRSLLRLGILAALVALVLYLTPALDPNTTDRVHRALTSSASLASQKDRIELAVKLQVVKNLLAERFPADPWKPARKLNAPALDRLSECTLAASCGPGEGTVVVLGSYHFAHTLQGHVSGEDIWAHSTTLAFQSLNYTLLHSYTAMETLQIYQQIPDLIPIIIFEGSELEKCVARNDETEDETDDDSSPGLWQRPDRIGCIKREGFEEGIPIWKSFAFHFWQHPASPIGSNWTLSPEDYEAWQPGRGNNYLGYSIEDRCTQVPVYDEREHRALILAKNVEMLQGEDFAWSGLLETVAKEIPKADNKPFEFVSTAGKSVEQGGPQPLPEKGVVSMGSMPQIKWWHEVAKSKAMLGVGRPFMSPSPYDAMCFGVPFINVIFSRDEDEPENRKKWYAMHDALVALGPPYVYHVMHDDKEGLEQALEQAIKNPIGRFIPPWMTLEAVRERHRALVERDWRSVAEEYMAEKWKDGDLILLGDVPSPLAARSPTLLLLCISLLSISITFDCIPPFRTRRDPILSESSSSVGATIASSTQSGVSTPFDSSPPTPRATSPDYPASCAPLVPFTRDNSLRPTPRLSLSYASLFTQYRSTSTASTPFVREETPSPASCPSSVGATIASSTRSGASTPFESSPPTPRATSPDYSASCAPLGPFTRDTSPAYSQRPRAPYLPPHRRLDPLGPSQDHSRAHNKISFGFSQGLGDELDHLDLCDLPVDDNVRSAPPAVITQVRVSGGYKWIDPPEGVSGPTIAVPGAPDVWLGRDEHRMNDRLSRDADLPGNVEFPDYNGETMPQGYDPLDIIFNSLKSPSELDGVQILTARNNLKKLFSFCCGGRRFSDFRLDARVLPGSKLVMLCRWELPSTRRGREPTNWHLSFHEQNTWRLLDGSDRTSGYHRILRYDFGGLVMMVKSDVSAALPWEGCFPDDVERECASFAECTSTSATPNREVGSDDVDDKDDVDDLMSLDSWSFDPTSAETAAKPTFATSSFIGAPRRLSNGITLLATPFPHPPQGHLISLKTRQTYAGEPRGLRHISQADETFAMLFFGQIRNLFLAWHRGGEFEAHVMEYRLGCGVLADMERERVGAIRKTRDVLRWIYECAIRYGSVGIVFAGGKVRCFAEKAGDAEGALSVESWEVIKASGIRRAA